MASSGASAPADRPTVIVCIGMAGSGKTTFMSRINSHLHAKKEPPYVLNLDPAVLNVPYGSHIDIRDSVDYREVMRQYNLGPNGGILTSLNLFATRVDQVISVLEKRAKPDPEHPQRKPIKYILIDTPGQIEVFAWSASGQILLQSLASSFPTVVAYIVDTPRTASPATFMSNMLYACSILYKIKLPMVLVFNKTDMKNAAFAEEWMTDFQSFQEAIDEDERRAEEKGGSSSYSSSLVNSMGLVLQEFYEHLNMVGVSSTLGMGVNDFFEAVRQKREEFERDYEPEMERLRAAKDDEKKKQRERELQRMMKDMSVDSGETSIVEKEDEAMESPEDSGDEFVGEDSSRGGLQSRYAEALEAEGKSIEPEASYAKYLYSQRQ